MAASTLDRNAHTDSEHHGCQQRHHTSDNTGIQDLAGNAGTGTTNSNNYAIDNVRPTASIVVADNSLTIGETSPG